MRVALYQDPRGGGVGGGEYVVAVLAEELRRRGHAVDYVHHQERGFAAKVADAFGTDLSGVGERALPTNPGRWDTPDAPVWRRRAAMRGWMRDASAGYDLFVCTTHAPPPVCHAKAGVLYVLFPFFDRRASWPWNAPGGGWAWARRRLYEAWWRERLGSYRAAAAISEFTRRWTRDYWGVDPVVIHPPVEVSDYAQAPKEDRVAVVGRFTPVKRQAELVRAFAAGGPSGWAMSCVGGLGDADGDRAYFTEVEVAAAGAPVELAVNAPRDRLRAELGRARVFWHAMGLDAPAPHLEEHFGIATVEAMAAGCVPVVPARGGQPEIVTDGETGFLCHEIGEYAVRTAELAADPARAARMAAAARDAAAAFGRPMFVARMMKLLGLPPLAAVHGAPCTAASGEKSYHPGSEPA